MRQLGKIAAMGWAAFAFAGCTVAIPDAAHFPEGRDIHVEDAAPDTADSGGKDAKADALDAKEVAGTDAIDVAPDAADADGDAALPDAATADAPADVADAATADAADGDAIDDAAPDASDDVAMDAVDVGPSCTPSQCDDGNPCTFDDCDAGNQCVHANLGSTPCPDDGLPCTGDACLAGVCTHTTLLPGWCIIDGVCYASGAMTADNCATCAPATTPIAFTPLPDTATCTDGTACTVADHCQGGVCLPGSATTCDDGNACTADLCDPTNGCSNPNLDDGSGCPASGVCQLPGQCVSGACTSSPKLWSTSFDGGTGGADRFNAVVTTASGQIIAVGARAASDGFQVGWAMHLDAAADVIDYLPALVDAAGDAHYSSVAVASDGGLALGGATSTDAIVRVIHASGVMQQVQPFSAYGAGDVTTIVAQGTGWLALDGKGHVVRLLDTGATAWAATVDGLGASVLHGIIGMADGGAIAVGSCAGLSVDSATALAVRFSASGAIVWERAFGNAGSAFAAVTLGADGTVFVTGARPNATATQQWFGHLSADGRWLGDATWSLGALTSIFGGTVAADGTWRLLGSDGTHVWQGAFDTAGNLLWQKPHDAGVAHGMALLAGGGAVIVGETPAPADGLVLRVDPWGEGKCAVSQLCSNLTLAACDDGLACTADLCAAGGTCSHPPLGAATCDDGNLCTVVDACAGSQCTAGVDGLFDGTDASVSQWSLIAARSDGGAVVAGTAGLVARLDAAGATLWSHYIIGGAVSDVAALANGWVLALQGDVGGTLLRLTDTGVAVGAGINVDGASGGKSRAMAVLSDDTVVVVGTASVGTPGQTAFVAHFDAAWTGSATTLPGSFGLSQGLAVAASAKGGCGVLTVEGAVAKIHRLNAAMAEKWSTPLSVTAESALAAMPDDGWLVAGLGPKGLAVERYGPDGAFEFAVQWPMPGLTDVRAVTVLPDGTSAVALVRLSGGFSQGGVARLGPLGGLLSIHWGSDGSQLFDIATAERPSGVWAVGSRSGGGWLRRTDSHGGQTCAASGGCVSESLICDDGNPCTNDGCAAGQCTITAPAAPGTCLDGGVCSAEGACPLLGTCGDGKCNVKETSTSCASDCQANCDAMNCDDGDPCTVDFCLAGNCAIGGAPDGTPCALGKACGLGQCVVPGCGDGTCQSGETATNCPGDCPLCGDGICGAGENNHVCPADCAKPASGCQNLCGWKSQKPGGGVCWCDPNCTPGPFGDCCDDKTTFCP